MKTRNKIAFTGFLRTLLALLPLGVVFTAELHAQLPNAWQITDNSTLANSAINYTTNLPTALQTAATNLTGGFHLTVNARFVTNFAGTKTMAMAYGTGPKRFLIWFNLNGDGDLTAELEGSPLALPPVAYGAASTVFYHTHEIIYDPATASASYVFDGNILVSGWPGSGNSLPNGQVFWGAGSTAGKGQMNFHSISFQITNTVVASYEAGTASNPAADPDPIAQGWTLTGASSPPNYYTTNVSPDFVPEPTPPSTTNLPVSGVEPHQVTLNGTVDLGNLPATAWFEWGLSTNYGFTTPAQAQGLDTNLFTLIQTITGLARDTTYHFRCVATNLLGIAYAEDGVFTTAPAFVVTTLADSGPGSLRQWIAQAQSGDTITFATNGTITLASELIVATDLTIAGPGAVALAINGNHLHRVFSIANGVIANLSGITIMNGNQTSGGGIYNAGTLVLNTSVVTGNNANDGGGLYNSSSGSVTINDSTFNANYANFSGGGVHNQSAATINTSTFSSNFAAVGGGIGNGTSSILKLNSSTVSGNQADSSGGGIYSFISGSIRLINSTVCSNTASIIGWNIFNNNATNNSTMLLTNVLVAGGYSMDGGLNGPFAGANNLIGGDPLLAPLGNYGGPTQTMPPLAGSPAIDAGNDSVTAFLVTDQRGLPRLSNLHVDIGAVEFTNAPTAPTVVTGPAADRTLTTATLNATVTPNGAITTSFFQYGMTTNYGSTTDTNTLSAGIAPVSSGLTNLSPATDYHFRAVGSNSGGRTYGEDLSFRTLAVNLVTNASDNGAGSLRQVAAGSDPGDIVNFANALSGQTILLTSGQITLDQDITIDASALSNKVQINGNSNSTIFVVSNGVNATLNSLIITNGYDGITNYAGGILNSGTLMVSHCFIAGNLAPEVGGGIGNFGVLTLDHSTMFDNRSMVVGGAIYNDSGATLNLNDSTVSGNRADVDGGGINNGGGTVTLNNTTLSGNFANTNGGGIFNGGFGTLTLNNSTLSGNFAGGCGGGIYNYGITARLTNSIVAANTAGSCTNIYGSFSGSNNLTSGNPLLAPPGNYGGPTQTMPPLPGSPVIDAGDDVAAGGLAYDQRGPGFPRVSGDHVDIGAVELQLITSSTPVEITDLMSLGDGTFLFNFTNDIGASFRVLATTNVALPASNWSFLGFATETPPSSGQFQFTDPGATNLPQRYYRVKSP